MMDVDADTDELAGNELSDEEVQTAVSQAFRFLATCAAGQHDGVSVADRINAAQAVLDYAASRPDLIADLVEGASELSGEDIDVIASALT
jgi:hypothetical protein